MVDSFGGLLRQLRQDRGWSTRALSEKIPWSHGIIGFIETGRQLPTPEFAEHCDRVFGTAPILTTLCGLNGEDIDMRRRALLAGFSAAAALGATSSYTALAEAIRHDLLEAAGVDSDWDATVADFQHRLVVSPDPVFGDELLASLLVARQQMAERTTPEAVRASAHLSLLYGLWTGNLGNVGIGHNFYRTAELIAERSKDVDTRVYVLARTAAGGPYQGLTRAQTVRRIDQALDLAQSRPSTGALEAHAATVQLAALTGDLASGQAAIHRMWEIADRLPPATLGAGAAQRTASFAAYLQGRLGSLAAADRAMSEADLVLGHLPQWHAEAQLYYAMAMVRHGDINGGLNFALDAAQRLQYPMRVIRLGVDDVLTALPVGYRDDLIDELRTHGTTGPKPWELIHA